MKKSLAFGCFAFFVSGCAVTPDQIEPAVSQYNGDSVSIQVDQMQFSLVAADQQKVVKAKMDARAAEICRRGHKKRAEYTSVRSIPTGQYSSVMERLYLCLN